jgi:3-oxoadipate enol-lactonase
MFARVEKINLRYRLDSPPGDTLVGMALVFIHALGCDMHIWDAIIPTFSERMMVLSYDLRGHGQSDAPEGPYTIRQNSEDLDGLLAALNIQKTLLVGISLGGQVALDFAHLRPDAVQGLVVCDSAPKIGTRESWTERIRVVSARGLERMSTTILDRWFSPGYSLAHPAEFNAYRAMLASTPVRGYLGACAALRDADLTQEARKIRVPVLAACGGRDVVVTPDQTREWASCLPNARAEVLNGAGHLLCVERPQMLARSIQQFLREDCRVL